MSTTQQVLSNEQIAHKLDTHVDEPNPSYPLVKSDWLHFARAIESATLKAVGGQEPVAYFVTWPGSPVGMRRFYGADEWAASRQTVEYFGAEARPLIYGDTLPPAQPAPVYEREAFEKWYVEHCPDIICEPIGCRLFAHQWDAWQARAALQGAQAPQATKGQP